MIKEQEKQEDILQKRLENRMRLQKNIESEKSILVQKTLANEKIKNKIEDLSSQIQDKEQAISLKKSSLNELINQDLILKNSVKIEKIGKKTYNDI